MPISVFMIVLNQKEYREDCSRKHRKYLDHTEEYVVEFMIQNLYDHYWQRQAASYYTTGKSDHNAVIRKWKKDYAGRNITLIHVTYQ